MLNMICLKTNIGSYNIDKWIEKFLKIIEFEENWYNFNYTDG